jgi:hypothetical protein
MMGITKAIGNIGIGNISTLATLNNDRFLIIDDKELYLIGASLKDLGRKCFGFTKMDAGEIARIKKAAFAMSVP